MTFLIKRPTLFGFKKNYKPTTWEYFVVACYSSLIWLKVLFILDEQNVLRISHTHEQLATSWFYRSETFRERVHLKEARTNH